MLGGTLGLSLINGYTPSPGDFFLLIYSSNRTGSFSEVWGLSLPGGLALNVIYGPGQVALRAYLPGDLNGDGYVGIDDLNAVLGNWNAGTPPTANATPEPASLCLLTSG